MIYPNMWGIILASCIWKTKKKNGKESKTLGQRSRGIQVSPSLLCNWNCPCCTVCIAAHSIHLILDCLCQQAIESCSCESTPITRVGSIPNSIKKSFKKGRRPKLGLIDSSRVHLQLLVRELSVSLIQFALPQKHKPQQVQKVKAVLEWSVLEWFPPQQA